jgi:hypothetical protein
LSGHAIAPLCLICLVWRFTRPKALNQAFTQHAAFRKAGAARAHAAAAADDSAPRLD